MKYIGALLLGALLLSGSGCALPGSGYGSEVRGKMAIESVKRAFISGMKPAKGGIENGVDWISEKVRGEEPEKKEAPKEEKK